MAAKLTANPDTRIIEVTVAPVSGQIILDVQTDIYSPLKDDWFSTANLQNLAFPFRTFGDPISPAEQIGPYVFFNNRDGWRFLPFDDDYLQILEGNLIPESGVQGEITEIWNARPGRSIIVRDRVSAQALTAKTTETKVDEIHKIHGLDSSNPMTVTPSSRVSGSVSQVITGNGKTSTTVTRS